MTVHTISLLDHRHAPLVNALRLEEYAQAKGFTVQPPGILWNRSDDQSIVLGAWADDQLVSTLRLEVIESRDLVEAKIECPWSFPVALRLPAMILSKMATRKAFRRSGINDALRLQALGLARDWGLEMVLGTMVAGSPRRAAMEAMGYQFFTNEMGWQTTNYQSHQDVVVAALDLKAHGDQALGVCRALAGDALSTFAWQGPAPTRRVVHVVR